MQVGSIVWTAGGQKGTAVKRGDELGYFAYGGSTVVALFPPGVIQCVRDLTQTPIRVRSPIPPRFDEDLLENSVTPIETLVRVGDSLGKCLFADGSFDAEVVLRASDEKLAAAGSDGPLEALKRTAQKFGIGQ